MAAPPQWQDNPIDNQPLSKVELSIRCQDLKNMDFFSKSDPMVVIFMQDSNRRWREYGRTELIMDNLNPEFVKKFIVDYYFEEIQNVKFNVYDIDSDSTDLEAHDFIGSVETTLAELAQGNFIRDLYDTKNHAAGDSRSHGKIIVNWEDINAIDNEKTFTIEASADNCSKIKGMIFSSSPNVFLELAKVNENGRAIAVYRTPVMNSTSPHYRPFELSARDLCKAIFTDL